MTRQATSNWLLGEKKNEKNCCLLWKSFTWWLKRVPLLLARRVTWQIKALVISWPKALFIWKTYFSSLTKILFMGLGGWLWPCTVIFSTIIIVVGSNRWPQVIDSIMVQQQHALAWPYQAGWSDITTILRRRKRWLLDPEGNIPLCFSLARSFP